MKNPPFGGTGGANLTGKPPEMMKDEKEDPPTPTPTPNHPTPIPCTSAGATSTETRSTKCSHLIKVVSLGEGESCKKIFC